MRPVDRPPLSSIRNLDRYGDLYYPFTRLQKIDIEQLEKNTHRVKTNTLGILNVPTKK